MTEWKLCDIPIEYGGGWEISNENGYTEITSEDPAYVILLLEENEAKALEIQRLKDEVAMLRKALGLKCTHDPKTLAGQPIGMYHCPECGEMVIAGLDHPAQDAQAQL